MWWVVVVWVGVAFVIQTIRVLTDGEDGGDEDDDREPVVIREPGED
jgi:hypothetical protein